MSKPRISFLAEEEIEAIHNASLEVLEHSGMKVMSEKALDILREAGAKVDYVGNRVTIPRKLVEEALRRAPKTIKYWPFPGVHTYRGLVSVSRGYSRPQGRLATCY